MKVASLLLGGLAALQAPAALGADAAPSIRGATLPWTTYEAEQARTTGKILGPDYADHTPAREASGRRCIALSTGQFLEITAKTEAQGIVVRYSIPDSADGRGDDTTLGFYVNGKLQKHLSLTSRYSYLYGEYPFSNTPSAGSPRNFWDELRLMPATGIRAGDVIRLQVDKASSAGDTLVDLIDLEQVPPELRKPADAISITDFGATANDASDDRPAILSAIAAAKPQKKVVWIPAGQFVVKGAVNVSDIAIQGAGIWYSTLVGVDDYVSDNRVTIQGSGSNVALSDLAIIGKLNYRNDSEPNDGIGGSFGTGSVIRNIWIEHTKTGAWIVNSDGLLVEGCRFRNTIADGINLCLGMRNTVVRNCTARGVGDDCFAMWPATYAHSTNTHGGNRFVHCTAQLPFLGQAFSIYGGDGNAVEDCQAIDIPYGAGLFASTTFPSEFGFRGITTYRRNRVERAGDRDGAIGTFANLVNLSGLRFEDIEVIDSPADAIKFTSVKGSALHDVEFNKISITNAGLAGDGHAIVAAKDAVGSARISNINITNSREPNWQNNSSSFELVIGDGNSGVEAGGKPAVTASPAQSK